MNEMNNGEKQYKTSAQKRAYQNEYNRTHREERHAYQQQYDRARNKALKALRPVLDEAAQHGVLFIVNEDTASHTWSIQVQDEEGCCRDVPTTRLPRLVRSLYIMGKTLRTLRMSDDWEQYYEHITP